MHVNMGQIFLRRQVKKSRCRWLDHQRIARKRDGITLLLRLEEVSRPSPFMINTSMIDALAEQSDKDRSSFALVSPTGTPGPGTLGEMIAIHAQAEPEAPAVVFAGRV